jgi:hypothetical protein
MSNDPLPIKPTIKSMVCRQEHFTTGWYSHWNSIMRFSEGHYAVAPPEVTLHRKYWEWAAIAQALTERGKLAQGKLGLGFAVGREPLASLFAAMGVEVTATDLAADDPGVEAWAPTNQHAAGLAQIHYPHLIGHDEFNKRVKFQPVDMRRLAGLPKAHFDFVWSSCALEHLGSLAPGLKFVLDSTDLLKAGGVGIHTTEFNVSSADRTLEQKDSSIYLRKHIENLDLQLRQQGRCLAEPDYFAGDGEHDRVFDLHPYYTHNRQHIKLSLGNYITTSIILVVLA